MQYKDQSDILAALADAEFEHNEAEKIQSQKRDVVIQTRHDLMKVHGIFPGAQVRLKDGRLGKITSVNVDFCWHVDPARHKPWVSGVVEKKDGGWGTRETNFYGDWTLTKSNADSNVQ